MYRVAFVVLLFGFFVGYVFSTEVNDSELGALNAPDSKTKKDHREFKLTPIDEATGKRFTLEDLSSLDVNEDNAKMYLRSAEAELPLFVDLKQGQKLVDTIKVLSSYGPMGYDLILKIVGILDADYEGEGELDLSYSRDELESAIPANLFVWALDSENYGAAGFQFRFRAYNALRYIEGIDATKILVNSYLTEVNDRAYRHVGRMLFNSSSEATAQKIIDILNSDSFKNGEEHIEKKRTYLSDILYKMPFENVDHYLIDQTFGENLTEKEVERLSFVASRRKPPASGYLIGNVVEKTQASKAGFKMGDIIVKYGDHDLGTMTLEVAKAKAVGDKFFEITVLRLGEKMTFNVLAGKLGIAGQNIKKK